jgi:DNA-binding transcriptional LysR family regulator
MQPSATTLRNRLLSRARVRHLHVFVMVAELQSVKRAADVVGISQPTATQALADLEGLLEVQLFLRHAQGMSPTRAGSMLLPLARRALGLVDETATRAAALAQGSHAVVRAAAIAAAMAGPLSRAMPAFARRHPEVLVELQEANAGSQAALLANGDVDCAVCRAPAVLPQGWGFVPLWVDRLAVVAGPQHPLAGKRDVGLEDLFQGVWLVTPSSIAAREVFDTLMQQAPGLVRTYSVVTASATMACQLLASEPLLSLVPLSVVQRLVATGQLVELAWPERLPLAEIGLLTPTDGGGPALERFVEFMTAWSEEGV